MPHIAGHQLSSIPTEGTVEKNKANKQHPTKSSLKQRSTSTTSTKMSASDEVPSSSSTDDHAQAHAQHRGQVDGDNGQKAGSSGRWRPRMSMGSPRRVRMQLPSVLGGSNKAARSSTPTGGGLTRSVGGSSVDNVSVGTDFGNASSNSKSMDVSSPVASPVVVTDDPSMSSVVTEGTAGDGSSPASRRKKSAQQAAQNVKASLRKSVKNMKLPLVPPHRKPTNGVIESEATTPQSRTDDDAVCNTANSASEAEMEISPKSVVEQQESIHSQTFSSTQSRSADEWQNRQYSSQMKDMMDRELSNLRQQRDNKEVQMKREIKEKDGFCRRVDSYDGQIIEIDGKSTYEIGNYLGGGVAGVVYEGHRLRPIHEYPVRTGIADQHYQPIIFSQEPPATEKEDTYDETTWSPASCFCPSSEPAFHTNDVPHVERQSTLAEPANCYDPKVQGEKSVKGVSGGAIAMDVAIEIPASPDGQLAQPMVVVDAIDAPSRSRHATKAASMNIDQSFRIYDDSMRNQGNLGTHTYPNEANGLALMDETVAIKILNPVGFRLLSPSAAETAVIVKEGDALEEDVKRGIRPMSGKHVWWIVNPNSRNLRALQRKKSAFSLDGANGYPPHRNEKDRFSKRRSAASSGGVVVDRGSPERGLRLSLVAAYIDPRTNKLRELPLTRCIEIWGHSPFGASELEFESMMDAIERVNAGHPPAEPPFVLSGSPLRGETIRHDYSAEHFGDHLPTVELAAKRTGLYRAAAAERTTVYCAALKAYIAVPAVPPKYLRWLRQRRAATKEIRNMMQIGRHRNVVHLYEVLEQIQESKSTMFLILELVRGGELFELISSNPSARSRSGKQQKEDDTESIMRKFFQELASGIAYCHANGIAHRDLKPENLLVHNGPGDERTLKIADFGLSATFALNREVSDQDTVMSYNLSLQGTVNDNSTIGFNGSIMNHASISPGPVTGLSPLNKSMNSLSALGATALSYLTCGNISDVSGCNQPFSQQEPEVEPQPAPLRRMTSIVGSPHYVAPEIISQSDDDNETGNKLKTGYDGTRADVWSAGVILYAMLFRSLPFGEDLLRCPRYQSFFKWYEEARQQGGRRSSTEAALNPNFSEQDEEDMLGPHWFFPSESSVESRDLIVAMLNPDPLVRLSIDMVMRHPWLTRHGLSRPEAHS